MSASSASTRASSILSARARPLQPPRRSLDHLGIGALRHRRQAERVLAHAFQLLGELQALVVVGADGEDGDDGGRILVTQVAQQREERLRFVLRLGEEQLLALVDRQDQRRRLELAAVRSYRRRFVGERLQQRLELSGAALDGHAQLGARYRILAAANAPSSADSRPVSPEIAARSGRMTAAAGSCGRRAQAAETGRRAGTTICRRRRRRG